MSREEYIQILHRYLNSTTNKVSIMLYICCVYYLSPFKFSSTYLILKEKCLHSNIIPRGLPYHLLPRWKLFCQDINIISSVRIFLNEIFPWRKCSVTKWRKSNKVYLDRDLPSKRQILNKASANWGPKFPKSNFDIYCFH